MILRETKIFNNFYLLSSPTPVALFFFGSLCVWGWGQSLHIHFLWLISCSFHSSHSVFNFSPKLFEGFRADGEPLNSRDKSNPLSRPLECNDVAEASIVLRNSKIYTLNAQTTFLTLYHSFNFYTISTFIDTNLFTIMKV